MATSSTQIVPLTEDETNEEAATTTSTRLADILKPDTPRINNVLYSLFNHYDRAMFGAVSKASLLALVQYLQNLPESQKRDYKARAVGQFILSPVIKKLYPFSYLAALRKIECVLHPPASPEYVGRIRKAYFDKDKVAMQVLTDFGVDPRKIMGEVFHRNFLQIMTVDTLYILLSSQYIDINYKYYRGEAPLSAAAIYLNKFLIWEVLVKFDTVDWQWKDKRGRNLAFWSVCCRSDDLFNFLHACKAQNVRFDVKDVRGNNALSIAVLHEKLDVVRFIVEECAIDPNDAVDATGLTLGHHCAERGYGEILEYLLSKGLKVDVANSVGKTAIDFAKCYHHANIMDVLSKHGVSGITA
mmetsp:Transcript_53103/g.87991  ORF Transcript_53103/g.87991 Transcript_53103/m.87991 type:complete len:356 (-) Transcript_53103:56-1123(-)|eukprot:CAMPEP_0202695278 /NCGR_PEP_ID=MMETSP1385-20130828/8912_1 /ASSEMBLY_ACC=CAM_ASM_000861 /TAXON_ID=933848 /ORGANISM="Elphidium margaritaceum" /LENGTH=355 /DNA_ID=CAMNT_0049351277 /DNA_START=8 /DNA_END=1075 /DNA_ORIENTATION=+